MKRALCLIVGLLLLPIRAHASEDAYIAEDWAKLRSLLEPAGIDFPLFKAISVWNEGQYLIGKCNSHIAPDDIAYWRDWWTASGLEENSAFVRLKGFGDKAYLQGLREANDPPLMSFESCQRAADDWFAEMKAANDDARFAKDAASGETSH